jgi:tripartite-type tricarboxylate transporter receptor subunit TctC
MATLRTLALLGFLAATTPVHAQTYPDRLIKFVAPTSPGPASDMVARLVAEAMSKVLKQAIVVENKPGAEQMIGLEYVAKTAPADGYTVGVVGIDGQALMPLVYRQLRFDPLKDLTLVAGVGEVRYLLASPVGAPPKNFKELTDAARAAPGKFNYGSSTPHVRLYTFSLLQDLDLDLVHVPFPSGAPFVTALAAGTIDWGLITEGTAEPVKSRLRIHAITGNSRSPANPNVPTFAELGFPRIHGPAYALAVRTGTPKAVIDKLSAAAAVALSSPEFKARAQKMLFDARYESPEAVSRVLQERFRFYQDLTQRAGIKPE